MELQRVVWLRQDQIRLCDSSGEWVGGASGTPVKLSPSPKVHEETFQIVPRRRVEALPPPLRSSPSAAVTLFSWSGHVWTAAAAELPAGGGGR